MSTPKNKRCKYPHSIGVRVDDELWEKIQNEAIMCDLSPSEYIRQMLGKRRPVCRKKIVVELPEMPDIIEKTHKVGIEFNDLAHYFNSGGVLDVDSGNRLTEAMKQLKSLGEDVHVMMRNFREKGYTYPRKNP